MSDEKSSKEKLQSESEKLKLPIKKQEILFYLYIIQFYIEIESPINVRSMNQTQLNAQLSRKQL